MEEINLLNELKKIGWGLLYVIGFILIVSIFKLTFWYVFGLICISRLVSEIRGKDFRIKRLLLNCCITLGLMFFLYWLSNFGLIGYIIGIAVICGYILYMRWAAYMRAIHHIEYKLYGKPLFKDKK